jgi:hypothetical protein
MGTGKWGKGRGQAGGGLEAVQLQDCSSHAENFLNSKSFGTNRLQGNRKAPEQQLIQLLCRRTSCSICSETQKSCSICSETQKKLQHLFGNAKNVSEKHSFFHLFVLFVFKSIKILLKNARPEAEALNALPNRFLTKNCK